MNKKLMHLTRITFGHCYLPLFIALFIFGCTSVHQGHQQTNPSLGFLAFGDSGYNEQYLGFEPSFTYLQYIEYIRRHWQKQGIPLDEFSLPPSHKLDGTDFFIQSSGIIPVTAAMTKFCEKQPCAFALMLGDNIYPNGAQGDTDDPIRFSTILEQPFKQLGKGVSDFTLYAALGDHDWRSGRKGRDALLAYARSADSKIQIKGNGFYSFVQQDAEFFILDTNLILAATPVFKAKLAVDGSEIETNKIDQPDEWKRPISEEKNQLNWLKNALNQSQARWKIVMGHHPLWSSGGRKFEQAKALRKLLLPILCNNADLYLAGHEHSLEVHLDQCLENTNKRLPLPIIISGAASKQRPINTRFERQQQRKYPDYQTLWEKGMTWGFVHIILAKQQAIVRMVTTPDTASGIPVVEKILYFPHRSR
ncbi:MAG: metallophosphoesterase [Methylococcaceae bacterium]|nr:metallophosphoesterase [Methylococcaceae bacterium]